MSFRDWINTPVGQRPSDAPAGGGARGGWERFGRGFQQGLIPSRGQVLTRGLNPAAYLLGGLFEGVGDAVRGADWYQRLTNRIGSERPPLPGGAETFGIGEDTPPARAAWVDEWIRNGSPPLPGSSRSPTPGLQSRVGAGRGTTIAQGRAAQDMFGGMRDAANAAITRAQARTAMQQMFGNEEK